MAASESEGSESIRVAVRQTDGVAVRGAVISLIDLAGHQVGRSTAAGDGMYDLVPPGPGTFLLVARADTHQPLATLVEVTDHEQVDLELRLRGESGLQGVVHAPDGQPAQGATVTLTDQHGEVIASRTTDVDGEYAFTDLLPGTYTVATTSPSLQPAATSVRVPETGQVRQDVHLVGGAEIIGVAYARPGRRPVPNARVSLLDHHGRVLAVTMTDELGRYEFGNLTEGEFTVVATGYPPVASTAHLGGGASLEHDVELGYPEDSSL